MRKLPFPPPAIPSNHSQAGEKPSRCKKSHYAISCLGMIGGSRRGIFGYSKAPSLLSYPPLIMTRQGKKPNSLAFLRCFCSAFLQPGKDRQTGGVGLRIEQATCRRDVSGAASQRQKGALRQRKTNDEDCHCKMVIVR